MQEYLYYLSQMGKIEFKRGERKIINGIERVYHGAFGTCHDFVRPIDDGRRVEYCLFAKLKTNENVELFGKVVNTFIAEPAPFCSVVCGSGSDLYSRGLDLWQMKEVAA